MAPNTIDFSSLDFDPTKNPVIYITLSVIVGTSSQPMSCLLSLLLVVALMIVNTETATVLPRFLLFSVISSHRVFLHHGFENEILSTD